jgi:hypothetical protein
MNISRVVGGALTICCALAGLFATSASASNPAEYGIETVSASLSDTQAGAHPDFTTTIVLKTDPAEPTVNGLKPPYARTKDLSVTVPPGLLGNINNFPKCTTQQLNEKACPQDSQIGITEVSVYLLETFSEPVYLMKPSSSDTVAKIGFVAGVFPTELNLRVRPEDDYAVEAKLENANAVARLVKAVTTLWGVPAAKIHDTERLTPEESLNHELPPGGSRSSGLAPAAFMTNPTRCGVPGEIRAESDSYQLPEQISTVTTTLPAITGCGRLSFVPQFSLSPTTSEADSSAGVDATLSLPQEGLVSPNVLATPHLKRAVVTLPQGMTLNPAAAEGLGACSEQQMGLISESPIRFNGSNPTCPESAKVGTVEIKTPVLPEPIDGSLYIAKQFDNPFHTLLAGYLAAQGQGVTLKLAGRFEVDQRTGQITAVFDENPQQPFEQLQLHFKGGDHGVLTTPLACGSYSITSALTPWSALNPFAPAANEVSASNSSFAIDSGPASGPCPNGSLSASISAGTVNPTAGAYSPLVLRLTRPDGSPRLNGLGLKLPPGLTGKLAGIPYCPDSAIAAAASLSQPGQGALELGSPSCPPASRLGSVSAGVGSGVNPFLVSTGSVYLAGPYNGAPLSLAIATPAVAGPFDLGDVVVRAALQVNPATAEITAVSDPIPTILDGIPLDLRDVRVNIDRPDFTLNPTSCRVRAFTGTATAENGATASLSNRFQATSCESLAFKPQLKLTYSGQTKRTGNPALKAVLTQPKGTNANIAGTTVILQKGAFIDNAHISSPCTRVQFNVGACPPSSILGRAKAWTPLLDQPLEGPVYFRSNGGERELPDLVADLNGQIHVILVGFIDSVAKKGSESSRVRTRFQSVPDAPVSRFVIQLKGGKRGLIENSRNLCKSKDEATLKLTGQNGKTFDTNRTIVAEGCGKHRGN